MLRELCTQHEFTVFSVRFDNPCPERIEWVRIPAPPRPLALLFIAYHLLCPIYYWAYRLARRMRFDLVQVVESNATLGDISYSHFCHAVYLRRHWKTSGARGLRGVLRYIDHKVHAMMEPYVYRRVKSLIVPSYGLARELENEYPWLSGKIRVLANPVELDRWRKPDGFDRAPVRAQIGIDANDFVLVFVALGHFERKGLPLLLAALAEHGDPNLKLLVVGGQPASVDEYRRRCVPLGLAGQVVFAGMQADIRRYLWASDAFVLPSSYEVFPLVCLQAAAAGLPLVVSPLNGVEEFLLDRENGLLVERTAAAIKRAIGVLQSLEPTERDAMVNRAQSDIQRYSAPCFVAAWNHFYQAWERPLTTATQTVEC
jgi:glycosyltransferase involved in cell wall biosynthesis